MQQDVDEGGVDKVKAVKGLECHVGKSDLYPECHREQ